jgi:hypothetical protein
MTEKPAIQRTADEVAARIIAHLQADTTAEDAAREAARDERVAAALAELREQGALPPPMAKRRDDR